jgi:hypothetical protein
MTTRSHSNVGSGRVTGRRTLLVEEERLNASPLRRESGTKEWRFLIPGELPTSKDWMGLPSWHRFKVVFAAPVSS